MDLPSTLRAAARGDRDALNALFERNLPVLEAFIRVRMGPALSARESVRDVAQSVCREAVADLARLEIRGEKEFRNWLFLEAGRKLLKKARFHRQERRDLGREAVALDGDDAATLRDAYASFLTPSRCADAREDVASIERAIAALPDAQRDAVTLTRLLGMSTADAARELGLTESAVRGLVARGLARVAALRSGRS
ncbi:MAG: sigma-70 family RNA polymerase sigma factor [Planctomycetes bacterium]|nr:sigma-70 family RNA polymerase sigma factor [Planctomycetota bacterium]